MLKDNKGITMITLVIMIIVIIILASITSYGGIKIAESSKYYEAVAELKTIQVKVNEIYEDYKNAETEEEKQEVLDKYGEDITSIKQIDDARNAYTVARKNNVVGYDMGLYDDYRYWSANYILQELDLEGIKYDFIVNLKTRTVIMVEGVAFNGDMYYCLCQIEDEQYNVNYEP